MAKFFHFYDSPIGGFREKTPLLLYFEVDKRDVEFVNNQDAVRQSLESFD